MRESPSDTATDRSITIRHLLMAAITLVTVWDTASFAQDSTGARQRRATGEDIAFLRGMIAHHQQALEMAALVRARTANDALHLLAERILVSQGDEITMMEQWLARHAPGAAAPTPAGAGAARDSHAMHAAPAGRALEPVGGAMPGMLSAAELDSLRGVRGGAFDRRFLEGMIRHHRGALTMVAALLGARGAARQPQLYQFAADVDADQRAEIARMQQLLAKLAPP